MAKCIRCGKPCSNGETMCDECKAWFQEKTGGSSVPGVKNNASSKNMNPLQGNNTKKKADEKTNISEVESTNKESKPATSKVKTDKPEKSTGSPKYLPIIIGAGLAVIVIVILGVFFGHKKERGRDLESSAETPVTSVSSELSETGATEYPSSPTVTPSVEEKLEIPDRVLDLRKKYRDQMTYFSQTDRVEAVDIGTGTAYCYDGKLFEVDVKGYDGQWEYFFYDDDELYYAVESYNDQEIEEVFFDNGFAIFWIDSTGEYHSESEAEKYWDSWADYGAFLYDEFKESAYTGLTEDAGEYILPNSDREYITKSDLYGLSEWEVRIARNEIVARHGRKFKDQALSEYFNNCSWYYGTIEAADFDTMYEEKLSEVEKKNVKVIIDYEKEKGYNQ